MKRTVNFFSAAAPAALILAGCAGQPAQTNAPTQESPAWQQFGPPVAHPNGHTLPPERGKATIHGKVLVYTGSPTNGGQVDIFHYPSGKLAGDIPGVNAYGMCVDAKGDVYVVVFAGTTVYEYAHGGTSPLKQFTANGSPLGCSVDAKNDLAVTSFSPAEVTIFAKGDPSKSTLYSGGPCAELWTMGYDDKGNLVGVGETNSDTIASCALLSGSKSMVALTGCCVGPIKIYYPGSTMWDGKYIALGDQEAGYTYEAGIWPATLSGSTLTPQAEGIFTDTCFGQDLDLATPFIFGKKNTPVNRRQATIMVGSNAFCNAGIEFWHYPQGGNPYKVWSGDGGTNPVAVTIKP